MLDISWVDCLLSWVGESWMFAYTCYVLLGENHGAWSGRFQRCPGYDFFWMISLFLDGWNMPFWKIPTSVEDYDRILGGAWRGWAMDFSISWYTSQRWRTCRAPSRICSSSSGLGPRKQPSEHEKRVKNLLFLVKGATFFMRNGLHVDEANRRETRW